MRSFKQYMIESQGVDESVVVRPEGWEAANDVPNQWTRSGHVYRGMAKEEWDATVGAGRPIQSSGRYSHSSEGTNFSEDAADAESYINFGRSDPRKTGRPTFMVEVRKIPAIKLDRRDYYWKADGPVPLSAVTRSWKFTADGGAVVAQGVLR